MSDNNNAAQVIEKLLYFALANGLIDELDEIYSRNLLMDIMRVDQPGHFDRTEYLLPRTAAPILDELCDIAVEQGLTGNTVTECELFSTRLMNTLTPGPSEVANEFYDIFSMSGIMSATDWFYELCKLCEYIKLDRVEKNIRWEYCDEKYGLLEVTVNLSKPEKDPEEIKKLLNAPKSGYPACMLCAENMGYAGRLNHPARQTLRLIPITLNGEHWYMQYSPYVYFDEHCIVLKHEHSQMKVDCDTIIRMLDFVEMVPHYFIGSNAGLPIVGGSILNHDHYQGGRAKLPMARAEIKTHLKMEHFSAVHMGIVNWPMNCIRLTSSNRNKLTDAAYHIMTAWEAYSDLTCGIVNSDSDKHNAITPYACMSGDKYQVDLVLRNNTTTDELPLGVFHPHPQYHHIKKENIGLIEVMGLFILPGRLEQELSRIADILTGETPYDKNTVMSDEALGKHAHWIEKLVAEHGTAVSKESVTTLLRNSVGEICMKVLDCSALYKDTAEGHDGLMRFLSSIGIHEE